MSKKIERDEIENLSDDELDKLYPEEKFPM